MSTGMAKEKKSRRSTKFALIYLARDFASKVSQRKIKNIFYNLTTPYNSFVRALVYNLKIALFRRVRVFGVSLRLRVPHGYLRKRKIRRL